MVPITLCLVFLLSTDNLRPRRYVRGLVLVFLSDMIGNSVQVIYHFSGLLQTFRITCEPHMLRADSSERSFLLCALTKPSEISFLAAINFLALFSSAVCDCCDVTITRRGEPLSRLLFSSLNLEWVASSGPRGSTPPLQLLLTPRQKVWWHLPGPYPSAERRCQI